MAVVMAAMPLSLLAPERMGQTSLLRVRASVNQTAVPLKGLKL